jgi:hypothetical protein
MKRLLIIILVLVTYSQSYGQWVQLGESIKQTKRGGSFAYTLAISGDGLTVIVGSYTSSEFEKYAGKIQVFRFQNEKWEQIGDDIHGILNDEFGWAVDISFDGNIIAVSARKLQIGFVRVFRYSSNKWIQMGGDLDTGKNNDFFGFALAVNNKGDVVIVGAIHNDRGKVTTFEFKDEKWVIKGDIIEGDNANSGSSVSVNGEGNIIALNAGGDIRVYKYENNNWKQMGNEIPHTGSSTIINLSNDGFTFSLGMVSDVSYGKDGGRTRVLEYDGNDWIQLGQVFYNHSGRTAKINGEGNIIATGGSANIDDKGQSYFNPKVYSLFNGQWRDLGLSIDEEENNNFIGSVISLSDDGFTIAIGGLSKISQFGYTEDVRIYTHSTRTFVKNQEEHQNIKLYPNPANDLVSIDVDGIDLMNEFTIIDINGKSVYNRTSPNSNLTIDLKQFSSGVYYLIIKNKEGTSREKLIVQ